MIENSMSLPPVFAASALYDSLLQAALRQFFGRATFETEPIPSLSSDGRLAIEPTNDPSVLSIRWFGSRHVLHVPARAAVHARTRCGWRARSGGAGGALSRDLRSQADARARRSVPRRDRRPLRRRVSRSDCPTATRRRRAPTWSPPPSRCCAWRRFRATRTARFRRACCCSKGTTIPRGHGVHRRGRRIRYSPALTGIKSFYRLCDGLRTLFLVNRNGAGARHRRGRTGYAQTGELAGAVPGALSARTRWPRWRTGTSASC